MRLVVLFNNAMIADVVCGRELVCIGSQEDCLVRLEDPRVAPRQIEIEPQTGGPWRLRQLDESCLVRINGRIVRDAADLSTGDEIALTDYSIRVYPDYEERGPARTAAEVAYTRAQLEKFAASKLPASAVVKRPEESVTLAPDQVEMIGQANVAASNCDTVESLMDTALSFFMGKFAANRVWMGVRRVNYGPMEYEEGRFVTGQPADLPALGHDMRPRVLDRAQTILITTVSFEDRTSILAGPLIGPAGVLGMVYIDNPSPERRFEQRDLEVLPLLLNAFAYQLDLLFKATARIRAAMVEGQVSVAHETQLRLTPRKLPQSDELQWGAFREPGREQSGDLYDVAKLPNGHVACMVLQVTASGATPTILMAQLQSAFRYACMHQDPPSIFLQAIGMMLYDGQRDHAVQCFVGVIDPATGAMRYSVAGEIGAYIIDNRGTERALAPLQPTPALTLVPKHAYPLLTETLEAGETAVIFTDGVTTARNRRNEVFGRERFVNILCDGFGQPASATLKEMLTDLRTFTEGGSQPNDITVLLAHRP